MLWKLWEDSANHESQENILQQALQEKNYLLLLGEREWQIPIHTYALEITSATKTKIDVLKKMIMHVILKRKMTNLENISELLRVDSLFVRDIVKQMMDLGIVENKQGVYYLTPIGEEQYKAGTILSQPETERISFDYSPFNQAVLLEERVNQWIKEDWEIEGYRFADEEHALTGEVLSPEVLRQYVEQSGKPFEVGGSEKIISKIEPLQLVQTKYAKCIEFQLYDMAENKVYARIWNGAFGRWDERFEEEITEAESDKWKAEYDEAIIAHFPERYDYIRNQFNQNKKTNKQSVEIYRGRDIREKFLHSFTQTKRKMLMVSPWISSNVIDTDMIKRLQKFAKQKKTLYISWGIAKNRESEDRSPSTSLLNKLKSIKHEDGTQAVFVRWFGNQHNKEIVIDDKTHLLGSFNWLSYRGDYDIRHESVVVLEDETIIQSTTEYIEEKFIRALEEELRMYVSLDAADLDVDTLKNWMKELIMMDRLFKKRKTLSDELIAFLLEHHQDDLIYEIGCMWARYQVEEFGVRSYLKMLLDHEKFDRAKDYYQLCLKHLKTSVLWGDSPELKEHKEWLEEQQPSSEGKPTPKKKRPPRKKKK